MIVQESISERLQSIHSMVSYFDRWKDELDFSCIPPYTQALITTPAKDLYTARIPNRISGKSSLYDVLQCCTSSRTVLVDRDDLVLEKHHHREMLFSRLAFLEKALLAPSLLEPISSLLDSIPSLTFVRGSETLDVVLLKMIESGFEEVGIIDGGVISFVLHVDDIFDFVFKEGVKLGAGVVHKDLKIKGPDENDEDGLMVETNAELQKRIAREKSLSVMSPFQLSAQQFCKMYWTEVLMVICILLDVICAIVDYSDTANETSSNDRLQVATGIILFVFTYEAIVRVFGFRKALLHLPFDIIDLSIVLVSVVIYVMALRDLVTADSKSVLTLTRVIRGLRMFKILKLIVGLLLRQRMMYQRDGFALDLSFITRSCIAMSRPSVGPSTGYSNPIDEVARFFTTKYPDRFMLFDLEAETRYSDEPFGGRVERSPVDKHAPPRLVQMAAFVERLGKLADEDPKTCIAVHCKSGRDRTGVMVAAWLLYSRFSDSADDAMAWFAARRIGPRARAADAIPMPSMRRYVGYMEAALLAGGYRTPRLVVRAVTLETCPDMDGRGGARLWLVVHENGREVHSSLGGARDRVVPAGPAGGGTRFEVGTPVAGDVRVTVYSRDPASGRDELCCFACLHTGFVAAGREVFAKAAVDVAAADARGKVFDRDFALVVELEPPEPAGGGGDDGTEPFRRIMRPSRRVVEEAARMRGRDAAVQRRFATRLRRKVLFRSSSAPGPTGSDASGTVVEGAAESLCCAAGPVVEHGAVDLFRDRDGAVQVNSYAYQQLSQLLAQSVGARIARTLVSGNKRRFVEDGFDLDLTYVTPRVIAMGFPSSGIESSYRNSMADVYRFFQERHAAHYLIVNLCSERAYSLDTFHGNCVRYPFPDHNPPALELMLPCCACIHRFLQADADNVVAIHCKAGKGRTGLLVVAYLMYCGLQPNAVDARAFYDWARTVDGKGLTIISQIRYAHYFEEQLRRIKGQRAPVPVEQPGAPAVVLHRVRMHTMPHLGGDGGCDPGGTVEVKSEVDHLPYAVFESQSNRRTSPAGERFRGRDSGMRARLSTDATKQCDSAMDLPAEYKDISLSAAEAGVGTRVAGDFKVTIYDEVRSKIMFFFWLHSAFLTAPPTDMCGTARVLTDEECAAEGLPACTWSLTLSKHEIDRAAKDTRCAHFDPDFRTELFFSLLSGECGTGAALEAALATSTVIRTESSGEYPELPLLADRESYQGYLQSLSAAGRPKLPFHTWLLAGGSDGGRDRGLRPAASPLQNGHVNHQLASQSQSQFQTASTMVFSELL